jgi:opacity protein-like surface antigen
MIHRKVMVLLMLATMGVTSAADAAKVVLPRAGQVGIGMQGQYGTMLEAGDYGDLFSDGAGLAVRLRYRMRYERAIGLTFERHGFDPRAKSDTLLAPLNTTLILTGLEIYQMFSTRTKVTKMLSAGVGLTQVTQKLVGGETQSAGTGVGDGFYLSAGGELEYFFWQSWAVDVSLRYHAILLHETVNHDVQLAAGVIFYTAN